MKRILLILVVMLFILGGCKDTLNDDKIDDDIPGDVDDDDNIPVDIDYAEVEAVVIFIDLLPEEIVESDRQQLIEIRELYEALNDKEKALVTNIEKLENAEKIIAEIDAYDKKVAEIIESLKAEVDEMIPDIIENDINLPTIIPTEIGDVKLLWYSTDNSTFSNKGKVIPGRRLIGLEIKTTLIFGEVREMYTQVARVKPITFSPLPTTRVSFAYYSNTSNFTGFPKEALDTLDVINYAFATVVNGEVNVLPLSSIEKVLEARKSGVRVTLCIGGYANEAIPFSKAAYTQEGRVKLAKSIVDAVEKYHFDGVDIDWEYPGYYTDPNWTISPSLDSANYTLFMKELRTQLKAKNSDYILSAAVPAGSYSRFEIGKLNDILDYFHLMTYDMDSSTVSTHHTALYSSANTISTWTVKGTVDVYVSLGASKSKLVIGAAFYGREFDLVNGTAIIRGTASAKRSIPYRNIATYYLSYLGTDVTRYWDDTAKAPYLYNSRTNQVVVYDDPESIKYKAQYAISEGVAGMMFWEYTQDNGDLLNAIYEHLVKNR